MVRYRVIHTTPTQFGCEFNEVTILEVENAISRKEIARRLNIDIDHIKDIEIIK
jgi:metal-sulfur cluster biosynthetic enzyme